MELCLLLCLLLRKISLGSLIGHLSLHLRLHHIHHSFGVSGLHSSSTNSLLSSSSSHSSSVVHITSHGHSTIISSSHHRSSLHIHHGHKGLHHHHIVHWHISSHGSSCHLRIHHHIVIIISLLSGLSIFIWTILILSNMIIKIKAFFDIKSFNGFFAFGLHDSFSSIFLFFKVNETKLSIQLNFSLGILGFFVSNRSFDTAGSHSSKDFESSF